MANDSNPLPREDSSETRILARARSLVDRGTTEMAKGVLRVPLEYYRSAALAERERNDLLRRTPLALAASAQLTEPGRFLVRSVLGTSVLMCRAEDGIARAFLNYCRHRGARVSEGCGSAKRLACPYHAWSYDLRGCLTHIPGSEGFHDIDAPNYGLVELPCEERHGFLWVVLTAGLRIDVSAHLGPLDAELARRNFSQHEYLTERTFSSEVNWKAALEAFAENYHFPFVHGRSLIGQNTVANTATYDAFGKHHRLGFPCPWISTAPQQAEYPTPLEYMVFIYWVFPNLVLGVSPVGVEIIDILPEEEPSRCTTRHGWMAAIPAPDEATREGYHALYEAVHTAVRTEDFLVLPRCGEGIRYAQHSHMLIGRNEIGVQHLIRALADSTGFSLEG